MVPAMFLIVLVVASIWVVAGPCWASPVLVVASIWVVAGPCLASPVLVVASISVVAGPCLASPVPQLIVRSQSALFPHQPGHQIDLSSVLPTDELFWLNLEEGYFACQLNNSEQFLKIFRVSRLCDRINDCFFGSDELREHLKCSNDCDPPCDEGVCLRSRPESQCHCNDGWGGKVCAEPDLNECKYRPCSIFAACTNTLGSYFCTCRPGFTGDGKECRPELHTTDINNRLDGQAGGGGAGSKCTYNGVEYKEGEGVFTQRKCTECVCRNGAIQCEREQCTQPRPACTEVPRMDKCCPQYKCPTEAVDGVDGEHVWDEALDIMEKEATTDRPTEVTTTGWRGYSNVDDIIQNVRDLIDDVEMSDATRNVSPVRDKDPTLSSHSSPTTDLTTNVVTTDITTNTKTTHTKTAGSNHQQNSPINIFSDFSSISPSTTPILSTPSSNMSETEEVIQSVKDIIKTLGGTSQLSTDNFKDFISNVTIFTKQDATETTTSFSTNLSQLPNRDSSQVPYKTISKPSTNQVETISKPITNEIVTVSKPINNEDNPISKPLNNKVETISEPTSSEGSRIIINEDSVKIQIDIPPEDSTEKDISVKYTFDLDDDHNGEIHDYHEHNLDDDEETGIEGPEKTIASRPSIPVLPYLKLPTIDELPVFEYEDSTGGFFDDSDTTTSPSVPRTITNVVTSKMILRMESEENTSFSGNTSTGPNLAFFGTTYGSTPAYLLTSQYSQPYQTTTQYEQGTSLSSTHYKTGTNYDKPAISIKPTTSSINSQEEFDSIGMEGSGLFEDDTTPKPTSAITYGTSTFYENSSESPDLHHTGTWYQPPSHKSDDISSVTPVSTSHTKETTTLDINHTHRSHQTGTHTTQYQQFTTPPGRNRPLENQQTLSTEASLFQTISDSITGEGNDFSIPNESQKPVNGNDTFEVSTATSGTWSTYPEQMGIENSLSGSGDSFPSTADTVTAPKTHNNNLSATPVDLNGWVAQYTSSITPDYVSTIQTKSNSHSTPTKPILPDNFSTSKPAVDLKDTSNINYPSGQTKITSVTPSTKGPPKLDDLPVIADDNFITTLRPNDYSKQDGKSKPIETTAVHTIIQSTPLSVHTQMSTDIRGRVSNTYATSNIQDDNEENDRIHNFVTTPKIHNYKTHSFNKTTIHQTLGIPSRKITLSTMSPIFGPSTQSGDTLFSTIVPDEIQFSSSTDHEHNSSHKSTQSWVPDTFTKAASSTPAPARGVQPTIPNSIPDRKVNINLLNDQATLNGARCTYNGVKYLNGEKVLVQRPCTECWCRSGDLLCQRVECTQPPHGCGETVVMNPCCPNYNCVEMSTINHTEAPGATLTQNPVSSVTRGSLTYRPSLFSTMNIQNADLETGRLPESPTTLLPITKPTVRFKTRPEIQQLEIIGLEGSGSHQDDKINEVNKEGNDPALDRPPANDGNVDKEENKPIPGLVSGHPQVSDGGQHSTGNQTKKPQTGGGGQPRREDASFIDCSQLNLPKGFYSFSGELATNMADCSWDFFSCTKNYGTWPHNKACCDTRFGECTTRRVHGGEHRPGATHGPTHPGVHGPGATHPGVHGPGSTHPLQQDHQNEKPKELISCVWEYMGCTESKMPEKQCRGRFYSCSDEIIGNEGGAAIRPDLSVIPQPDSDFLLCISGYFVCTADGHSCKDAFDKCSGELQAPSVGHEDHVFNVGPESTESSDETIASDDTVPLHDTKPSDDTIFTSDSKPSVDVIPTLDAKPSHDTIPIEDAKPVDITPDLTPGSGKVPEIQCMWSFFRCNKGDAACKKDHQDCLSGNNLDNQICASVSLAPQKYLVPHPTDCTKFYSCQREGFGGWIAHPMDCPVTTAFDTNLRICNYINALPRCNTGGRVYDSSDFGRHARQTQHWFHVGDLGFLSGDVTLPNSGHPPAPTQSYPSLLLVILLLWLLNV